MALEQPAQLRQFLQIIDRDRRHLEAAPSLSEDKALRGKATQDLTQRADADAVGLLEAVELELLLRPQATEDDIRTDAPIAVVANGFAFIGSFGQRHDDPLRADAANHPDRKADFTDMEPLHWCTSESW
jgi:hypothetical protein